MDKKFIAGIVLAAVLVGVMVTGICIYINNANLTPTDITNDEESIDENAADKVPGDSNTDGLTDYGEEVDDSIAETPIIGEDGIVDDIDSGSFGENGVDINEKKTSGNTSQNDQNGRDNSDLNSQSVADGSTSNSSKESENITGNATVSFSSGTSISSSQNEKTSVTATDGEVVVYEDTNNRKSTNKNDNKSSVSTGLTSSLGVNSKAPGNENVDTSGLTTDNKTNNSNTIGSEANNKNDNREDGNSSNNNQNAQDDIEDIINSNTSNERVYELPFVPVE